jgi:hypothetical protein
MTDDADDDDKPSPGRLRGNQNLKPFKSGAEWRGNAKGRPPRHIQEQALRDKISDSAEAPLKVVHEIMMKKRVSPGDEIKLRAANSILDRHIGKAPQSVSAYVTQRTVAADGTIVEGGMSGSATPLLQAAQAHLAQEQVRKLNPPAEPLTGRGRSLQNLRQNPAHPRCAACYLSPNRG